LARLAGLWMTERIEVTEVTPEEFHGEDAADADADRRLDLRRRFGWDVDAVGRANLYGATRDVEEILVRGIIRARRRLGRPS
jgi:hypothetical protein